MAIRLGNGSVSSLVRSAASISNSISAYNDAMAKYEWQNSLQTEADFNKYATYLQGRAETLNTAGGYANATKAASYSQEITTAQRSFFSNQLQRTSTAILEGQATSTDKYNQIVGLYNQAVATGDLNSAQNLRQQADALSQQMQYDHQQAASAYNDQAKLQEQGLTDAAKNVPDFVKGMLASGKDLAGSQELSLIKQVGDTLGVKVPTGKNVTMGSLLSAAFQIQTQYYQGAQAIAKTLPGGTFEANSLNMEIQKIKDGVTTVDVPGIGALNFQQVSQWADNPKMFYKKTIGYDKVTGAPIEGYGVSGISGYKVNKDGTIAINYTGNGDTGYSVMDKGTQANLKSQLSNAGFNVSDSNGYLHITATDNPNNAFFKQFIQKAGYDPAESFRVLPTKDGLQIIDNGAKNLFTLKSDTGGNFGLYHNGFGNTSLLMAQANFMQENAAKQNALSSSNKIMPGAMPGVQLNTFQPQSAKIGPQLPMSMNLDAMVHARQPASQGGGNGVYWHGSNGQVYVKGGQGTNAAGQWDNNTENYWNTHGFREISDPNPGGHPATPAPRPLALGMPGWGTFK